MVVDLEAGATIDGFVRDGVELVRADGPRRWLRFDREAVSAASLISSVVARAPVVDVAIEEPAIEDIIRGIYEGGLRAEPAVSE